MTNYIVNDDSVHANKLALGADTDVVTVQYAPFTIGDVGKSILIAAGTVVLSTSILMAVDKILDGRAYRAVKTLDSCINYADKK